MGMFSLSKFCIYGGVYMQSYVAPHSSAHLLSWEKVRVGLWDHVNVP